MSAQFNASVTALAQNRGDWLSGRLVGLEKESIRTSIAGTISQRDHPIALGAALTHPHITTDFGEAMLEFVTPPCEDADSAVAFLADLHRYTVGKLDNEKLWAASMPCVLQGENSVRIGEYGHSNIAQMKHVYRCGLGLRYGKSMQAIAGIHVNLSWPLSLWECVLDWDAEKPIQQAQIDNQYLGLLRNVQRHGWLLLYLFGASPAICTSFIDGAESDLESFDQTTAYRPFGTSLRMSNFGYRNSEKAPVRADYNSLSGYVASLREAISTPWEPYRALGIKDGDNWRQLNANMLQIENEYYSGTRPKQIAESLEKPSTALARRGVRYIELRTLDVNPFAPSGIDVETLRFVEVFALCCLLWESPPVFASERRRIDHNNDLVANRGREPGLRLEKADGELAPLRDLAAPLFDDMAEVAALFGADHVSALAYQLKKVSDAELTPSAEILQRMRDNRQGFFDFAWSLSQAHDSRHRSAVLAPERVAAFDRDVTDSLSARDRVEMAPQLPFDDFIAAYLASE